MTETNAKIHVLADETLGGIKREYVEVDRKAEVGEKVIVVDADVRGEEPYDNGNIFEVRKSYKATDAIRTVCDRIVARSEYRVLVPVETAEVDEPQPADPIFAIGNVAQEVAKLKRTVERLENEIDTLHKDNRTLGEELARLKEPKDNEINYEDAALVFIQRKVAGPVEVYQDGKRLRGVLSVNINAKVGELTTHTIEFGTGNTAGERP